MKKILVGLFTLIAINSLSQYAQQPAATGRPSTWWKHTPGLELRKAGNTFFTGLALETAGFIFIGIGSSQTNLNGTPTAAGAGDVTIGAFMVIAGGVCNILAWVHVNRAGRLMDLGNKVSLGNTKNGIGLTYSFK